MARAEDLFSRIESTGELYLDELIEARKSEESFLDFKRSADDGATPRLHDRDRNNLARALSGFSNSEGGVVVWGIDCASDSMFGDVAKTKHPLSDPYRFVSQLEAATSGLTVPPVQATRSIPILTKGGGGFVATLVPRSLQAPHQLVQEKRYLIRAGSSFEPVPHGVLAGLFGRHPQPNVLLNFLVKPLVVDQAVVKLDCALMLVNNGNVVAEDLFLSLLSLANGGTGSQLSFDTTQPDHGRFRYTGATGRDIAAMGHRDFRLPPGAFVHSVRLQWVLHRSPDEGLNVRIHSGCSLAQPNYQQLQVSKENLIDLYTYACERWADSSARAAIDWHEVAAKMLGHLPHWKSA